MPNDKFIQKLIADELLDTIFFSSAKRAVKTRTSEAVVLTLDKLKVTINSSRNIRVNKTQCKSSYAAKCMIMDCFN